jgi:hypothetical protein
MPYRSLAVLALLALAMSTQADAKTDGAITPRWLEISLKDPAKGKATDPIVIKSKSELTKAITDEDAVMKIANEVNFNLEQLVYFAWSGSGQDKITFEVGEGEKKGEATFTFTTGRTRDLRPHRKLAVLPKDAKFKVVAAR